MGWFVLGDVLLDGLVTRVAQVLKVGDGSSAGLTLDLDPLLVNGGRSADILRFCLDGLDLSHPLDGLDFSMTFGAGDPPLSMVFGGTFGGTSGALIGETGERGTAVVGVLHSIGEKIGDNGLVGLKAAAVSRNGVAHWAPGMLSGSATLGHATPANIASPNGQSLQLPGTLLERSW
jgi:hypothetical protein